MRKILGVIIIIGLVGAGCATQRFGRLQNLTEAERTHLSCQQVDIEIEKAQEFISQTTAQKKDFTGKDVLSFLGDFGIGDNWEYKEAVGSADTRLNQLMVLRRAKACG